MMRKMITLAAVAGVAVSVVQAPASASTSSALSASSSTATTPLSLRGGLTLELPSSWHVYGGGDQIRVVTGACARPKSHYFEPKCRSFWVMGQQAIKTGGEGFQPYNPNKGPFYPAVDVAQCATDPSLGQVLGKAIAVGYRAVGVGHRAQYRVWPGRCVRYDNGEQKSTFNQREWYLPKERVLIVDQWGTPGLPTILKNAVWR
ncbi:hypothetical protein [Microtetraspora sp. NBRC 16547]|uniref:hypothetical protein n=1 Tax=Microtetraspora sp. NBRC 16547 TaxID=3030993 RepID=UPI002553816F|nr:hypothetical protein [Microtetraspora sp. NBRC 16547]